MSATILGKGLVRELIDSNFIESAPQVHLHFFSDEEEYEALGYGKLELCCHGCGTALLVYYTENEKTDLEQHVRIRDAFTEGHKECVNRGYEHVCPEHRSSIAVLDMRTTSKRPILRSKTRRVLRHKEHAGRTLRHETFNAESVRAQTRRREKGR
jgi:hypothetical protein